MHCNERGSKVRSRLTLVDQLQFVKIRYPGLGQLAQASESENVNAYGNENANVNVNAPHHSQQPVAGPSTPRVRPVPPLFALDRPHPYLANFSGSHPSSRWCPRV